MLKSSTMTFLTYVLLLFSVLVVVTSSPGDYALINLKCLSECQSVNCSLPASEYSRKQPTHMRWLGWTCLDECKYTCMWITVDAFHKDSLPTPQFHGKWPFIRVLGVQEPLSALFSFLNGLLHAIMLVYFLRRSPRTAPMRYVWIFYAFIAMNAWFWSTVFHTRDTIFTEVMDYFCATLFILVSVFCLCARVSVFTYRWFPWLAFVGLGTFYYKHVYYLAFVSFNYSYNMTASVTIGLVHGFAWVAWSWWMYTKRRQTYVWKAATCVIYVTLLVLLELFDFPPLLWFLDAHALWHLGTIPVPLLMYRFLVDDAVYLDNRKKEVLLGDGHPVTKEVSASKKGV